MKVSIGFNYTNEAYGGGNSFVKNLSQRLQKDGHIVVNNLNDKDIDIILLINPLKSSELSTFDEIDVLYYQNFINKKAVSIQRFNECDERKGTNNLNQKLIRKNKNIDFNIFVSKWLFEIFSNLGLTKKNKIILGGPDEKIFNQINKIKWNKKYPINLVTHHWSSHKNKGYDTYKYIDDLLDKKIWKEKLNFTIIGNVPNNLNFKNTKIMQPLKDVEIAEVLKYNDIYITASKYEPSGNHHMEAALCGLPIMYIKSGGVEEYCRDFGVEFTQETFEQDFEKLVQNYDFIYNKLSIYPYNFENLYIQYLNLFRELKNSKKSSNVSKSNIFRFSIIIKYFINKFYKLILQIYVLCKIKIGKIKKMLI